MHVLARMLAYLVSRLVIRKNYVTLKNNIKQQQQQTNKIRSCSTFLRSEATLR